MNHLLFQPSTGGVPHFDAEILVHLDDRGRVWRVKGGTSVPPAAALTAGLSASQAIKQAMAVLAPKTQAALEVLESERGASRATVLRDDALLDPVPASLVWFPRGEESVPAWQIYLAFSTARAYWLIVDAADGQILFSQNLTREAAPQGRVFRAPDTPHPDAGSPTLELFTGWQQAEGNCPADVYPAAYRSGALLNRCWVDNTETRGNNADACLDLNADNLCDGRAISADADFNFVFTDAYRLSNDPVTDRPIGLANAFYWVNVAHDWLYRLGFDEAAGNFQQDNFGRGGADTDSVKVDVQDGGITNNATFLTPPDGIVPRMELGLFNGFGRDSAFDADIIVHEYVHGLTTRLIGGPTNVTGLWRWHSGAMAEGWSDIYAASLTGDPTMAEYSVPVTGTGLRSVAYDDSPYTFGQLGTLFAKLEPVTGRILELPQVHRDGEIWATVLWDLRKAAPGGFEALLTDALKLTPPRPSMLDARDAIVQAAVASGVGGASACEVWSVFAARGFGASAALNPFEPAQSNDTALSVFETFDVPSVCGGTPPASEAVLFEDGAETDTAGWQTTGLWHRTQRRAAGGVSSWWFGDPSSGAYNLGARAQGDLTSPPIDLRAVTGAILEWDQYLDAEGFNKPITLGAGASAPFLNADSGRVHVTTDAGASWQTVTHVAHDSAGGFEHYQINLTRFAGSVIQVRFDFDTFDATFNDHEGWFLDNIRVQAIGEVLPTIHVSPASIELTVTAGAADPAPVELSVTASGGASVEWSAETMGGTPWLTLSPSAGAAPSTITASVTAGLLDAGAHTATIRVQASGAAGSPLDVPVTLTVAPPAGPTALWRSEETGPGSAVTLADSSGHGHDALTGGYGSVPAPGVWGNGRLFNGISDFAQTEASSSLTPARFTVRSWIRLESLPEILGVVASAFGGANSQGWFLGINPSGRAVFMAAAPGSSPWLVSNTILRIGRWYQVSVTYDSTSNAGALYVDGAFDAGAIFPGLTPDASVPFTMGRASWWEGYYLNAVIDEMEIYPAVQSPAEILEDFESFRVPAPAVNAAQAAEWHLEGDLLDSSGNGHHGELHAATPSPGVEGEAFRFDGISSWGSVPADYSLTPSHFTLRAWVRMRAAPSPFGIVISNFGGNDDGWYLAVKDDGRVIFCTAREPGFTRWVVSETALRQREWHHVTITYEGPRQFASVYIDGQLDTSTFVPGISPQSGGLLTLGKASWYDTYYLPGDLDEIRLDAREWDASEVQADYLSFAAGTDPPEPVAAWEMDETGAGAGVMLADNTSGGRHATTAGGGTQAVAGHLGAARRFDGLSDHAVIAAHPTLSTDSFSLTSWVKLESYPNPFGALFSTLGSDYRGWFAGINSNGQVILSISGLPDFNSWLPSNTALELGRWYHITVAFDGPSRRGSIYIDGVFDRGAVFGAFTAQTAVNPTFGRASWFDGYYLNAVLDRTGLYGEELTPAQARRVFEAP